jgi:hypothetical protein
MLKEVVRNYLKTFFMKLFEIILKPYKSLMMINFRMMLVITTTPMLNWIQKMNWTLTPILKSVKKGGSN